MFPGAQRTFDSFNGPLLHSSSDVFSLFILSFALFFFVHFSWPVLSLLPHLIFPCIHLCCFLFLLLLLFFLIFSTSSIVFATSSPSYIYFPHQFSMTFFVLLKPPLSSLLSGQVIHDLCVLQKPSFTHYSGGRYSVTWIFIVRSDYSLPPLPSFYYTFFCSCQMPV